MQDETVSARFISDQETAKNSFIDVYSFEIQSHRGGGDRDISHPPCDCRADPAASAASRAPWGVSASIPTPSRDAFLRPLARSKVASST